MRSKASSCETEQNVPLLVERHGHFVDDLETATLTDRGLHLLGFIGPDVVLSQNLLDGAQTFLDHGFVIRGAVTPQQVRRGRTQARSHPL